MAIDNSQPQEVDLDRTDKLPILDGTLIDADVEDDAVRMDFAPAVPSIKSESARPAGADGPLPAARARAGEDGVARQSAEFEALKQAYQKSREAEAAAGARAQALAADLGELRVTLESERARSREIDKATRARIESNLRESERHQRESRTLRDTLATRDATIVQVQHSLSERDAQLSALQREHAQVVPALEERSRAGTQLETDLRAARARHESMAAELKNAQQTLAVLTGRLKADAEELNSTRRELNVTKARAAGYLEHLRTREWRRGFDQTLFLELDAKIGAAQEERGTLQSERDQLRTRVNAMEVKLATRDGAIATLKAAATDEEALRVKQELKLRQLEAVHAKVTDQLAALESERSRLSGELTLRDSAVVDVRAAATPTAQSGQEPPALEKSRTNLTAEQLYEDNRSLRAALERARGALEEREFMIRRLERSDTNNAIVPGRLQASIEQGGAASGAAGTLAPLECSAELVRIDGEHSAGGAGHTLARRTRIGRAPGCELQIESSSVSRHHALVLVSSRDVIIEDLHSTNGVLVNGRKIARQPLNDGDVLTIGEAQFRLNLKLAPRVAEAPAPAPP
ncbi:MAG TPA: FHA domain-containing protein [Steroidobacteraceae bacterium]|nr:FHA domain-containing protein [Steroidobacteraceae bacterium]